MAIRRAVAYPDRIAWCEPAIFNAFAFAIAVEIAIMFVLLAFQPVLLMATAAVGAVVGPAVHGREPDLRGVVRARTRVGGWSGAREYEP